MHAVYALLTVLGLAVGVALLFMLTSGWSSRSGRPDDDRAPRRAVVRDTLNQGLAADQGERRVVGRYRMPPYLRLRFFGAKLWLGRRFIEIERAQTADPVRLVAVLVHELAHCRLLGEGRVTIDQPDQERLTDLLTVYFGFGIFTANMQHGFAPDHG